MYNALGVPETQQVGSPCIRLHFREQQMRLASFILANIEPILCEWEIFARSIGAGEHLDKLALRDHAEQILRAAARDMRTPQTDAEQEQKSKGLEDSHDNHALDGASDAHAVDRLSLGFNMLEVISEYRALRASVLQLWRESSPAADERNLDDLTRFNESIDQSLTKAVAGYAGRVDQARDMFLAILSHDLRNPLSTIAMASQTVPMVIDDRNVILEFNEMISRSASVMERMINDLLDFTRTRLGAGIPIQRTPLDLAPLGRELYEEFCASHPDHDIQIRTDGDLHGLWDADRIRQAITNLIGNALQHGSADFPVTLSLRGDDSNVFIEVRNGGDLIPPGELSKIFDPLVRGASSERPQSNRHGSIGMGLYIASEVAKSHNGRIEVTSSAEDGTSFAMYLPREPLPQVA